MAKGSGNPALDAELADMALALAHNPKTRKQLAKAVKDAGLSYKFNDVEAEETVLTAAGELVDQRLEQAARRSVAAATTQRLNDQRAKLISEGRFTEATVKEKLEPFMEERGIGDYEDGAILYGAHNPDTTPRPEIAAKGVWELPVGDWLKDPRGTARKNAMQAVGDIMSARR